MPEPPRATPGRDRGPDANVQELLDIRRALNEAAIVATTDVTGRITSVNDKFTEISGYSRDELLGQDHRVINSAYHSKEFIRDLWRTIASGRVWRGEIRNRRKNGEFYWVDTTIVPFLDAGGKPYQYVAIRADITARKAAEDKLREQAALARVGQMAAVVAHEVRNPLAGIKGAIQILRSRRPAGDAETEVMDEIVARIDALNGLLQDLMQYARPRPARRTPTSLLRVAQEAATMLREDPAGAAVEVTVEGDEVIAQADGEMLRAAVFNLLINAAQAMEGRGRIRVAVAAGLPVAAITVHDSGPGIPADVREQMFEPFFTTKARGGGLGLAIARRTAEMHDGSLALDCPAEGGTVATLRLAASGDQQRPDAGARARRPAPPAAPHRPG